MKRPVCDFITLTAPERRVRELLVEYCNYYNTQNGIGEDEQLELRITGGWVRDKLLGNESHDIDIAVNHLTGEQFAHGLSKYVKQYQPESDMHTLHTIKKNPDKSKHLETCTTKLYGIDIDFVNLRSEEYSLDSRVPVIEFGTPQEDALRRDATLNALFYNLNHSKIEDFTGKGLEDLQHGLLRTPLPPIQTFLDDPLRIIRLVRFASKFNFMIEHKTLHAMKEKQNKIVLSTKISKERIEIELRKILTSKNAGYGLQLINYTGLAPSIFYVNSLSDEFTKEELKQACDKIPDQITLSTIIYPNFKHIILNSTKKFRHAFGDLLQDEDSLNIFWLAVILQPYSILPPRKPFHDAISKFLKDGLKSKRSDVIRIAAIAHNYKYQTGVLKQLFHDPKSIKRSDLGLYLRQFPGYAPLSIITDCLLDCIHDLADVIDIPSELPIPYPELSQEMLNDADINRIINENVHKYEQLFATIDHLNLTDVHNVKPLIDGTTLSKRLNLKPGPWLKSVNDEILVWQLDNVEATPEDCFKFVESIISNYTS
ncbi:CCA tRNA nucleotidyltransferase mitochondrial [Spathaspora sp. JA1]|nr:CCA tRNA nucleotidyltransferase mitochondrial [Spathaspora sp. JA1]